ncbi:hypothetical protein CFE70_008473 [Pyrenophora teres f. teres 0-1]|uniref:Uncharacterized protein n=1 Tax=Pyrenophora teres f. teres (strain 0-1) TaxID=861557 RepID=E3RKV5_PYRTT|nr:hypothetical protein PTT_08909 [Pyrenophora teres f. teres 0-1]
MCYYRFYIFLGCGHHTFSETPIRYCEAAKTKASADSKSPLNQDEGDNAQDLTCGSAIGDDDGHTDGDSSLLDDESIRRPDWSIAGSRRSSCTTVQTGTISVKDTEPATPVFRKPCGEGRVYPLHTFKLEQICPVCANERDKRLRQLDKVTDEITFDAAKWHCKYQGDHKGKNGSGGKKAHAGWNVGTAVGGWMKDWNRKDGI